MIEEISQNQELDNLPSAQIAEMSAVAVVQAQVLEIGLVRELRPVFVYDEKLAQAKKGGAARQAKYVEKLAQKGIVTAQVPKEIVELVKTKHAGSWLNLINSLSASGVSPEPPFSEAGRVEVKVLEVQDITVFSVITTENLKIEITKDGGIEPWLRKKITFAIDSLPKPASISPKIVERIVEKPVIKLTSEQKISLLIGEKVQKITGWRAFIARKLLNI